ncbi:MAG TPA: hypothetical protein VN039_00020 [Nitrospira sp.]|nr:hypothetical protein [Nitrospira sp.]
MSDKYVASSPPALTPEEGDWVPNPIPHRPIAGNTADDDGIALDQMFESMELGPQSYEGAIPKEENPKHTTRLLVRTLPVDGTQPVQFLPRDPYRVALSIVAGGGPTADAFVQTEQIMIGTSKGDTYGIGTISMPVLAGNGITLEGYTGALWINAQSLVATRNITVISHTR